MKDKLWKIKGNISFYFDKLKDFLSEKLKDPQNRKAVIAGAAIIAATVVTIVIIYNVTDHKDTDDTADWTAKTENASENEEDEETISLKARLGGHKYEVRNEKKGQFLYTDGKKTRKSAYSNIEVMDFDLDSQEKSKDLLKRADAGKPSATGSRVFRGTQYQIENYLAYLKNKGYEVEGYIMTGGYTDIYLKKDNTAYRFLVIDKLDNAEVLIFDTYNKGIPTKLPVERKDENK